MIFLNTKTITRQLLVPRICFLDMCITHIFDFTRNNKIDVFFYFQGYNNYRKFLLIEEAILRNLVSFSSNYIKTNNNIFLFKTLVF